MNHQMLESLIKAVVCALQEEASTKKNMYKTIDKSGVLRVEVDSVTPEPFDTGKPGDKVLLKDIVTLEESPRIGAGLMEMTETTFDWTLHYDEFDYIIDGELTIIVDGNKVTGKKGDVIYIPKDTSIQFSTEKYAKFMYFTYPADWQ